MHDRRRNPNEGTSLKRPPGVAEENLGRAFQDIENFVIRLMAMGADSVLSRLQYPLGDAISVIGFGLVSLEDRGQFSHRISPPAADRQGDDVPLGQGTTIVWHWRGAHDPGSSSQRRCISSGFSSSMVCDSIHLWPKGSSTIALRSPKL